VQDKKYIFSESEFDSILERTKKTLQVSSDKELGEALGISSNALSNRRKSKSVPWDHIFRIASSEKVNIGWLITGIGPIYEQELQDLMTGGGADADYTEVPLYNIEASAGHGSLFDHELISSYLKFRNDWLTREGLHPKDLVAIRVSGDSMNGTLANGDTVLIDRSRKRPDGVFAIRIGDALRIKRLQKMADGSLRVSSDNEIYQPEIIHPENMAQVDIVGQCYWRGGRVF